MSVAYFLLSVLGVSVISRWIEDLSVDADAGELIERKRSIQWGRHAGHWYFYVALPSWCWEYDLWRGRNCWHRRFVTWNEVWGWKLTHWPDDRTNEEEPE